MKHIINYVWPIVLCFTIGFAASKFQSESMVEWYPYLKKSVLTPPGIVFPVVWSLLYLLMGISMGRLLNIKYYKGCMIWVLQLIFNFLWSILFFTMRMPVYGLVDIVILDILVAWYIYNVYNKDKISSWLFVPYFIWLLLASYLNIYIYINN